ncbi:hypothetical protein CMO88_00915 [Candidatus Woesearchaeota archaeon]|nr:hypothetical protein [Candidatus Woesearchaeota archaeon]|tara:strand:- start:9983 stop:11410 length:1428 start_codon:yes stop_codon:yes gene_type:complete
MKAFNVVFKNTAFLFSADVISRLLSFSLFLVIARTLGKTGLGDYSFIFAFTGLFWVFNDLGISTLFVREAAKDLKKADYLFKNVLSIKILLVTLVALATIIGANFTSVSANLALPIYVVALAVFFQSFKDLSFSVFQAHQRMLFVGIARSLEMLLLVVLGILALLAGYGLLGLAFAFLISYFLIFVLSAFAVRKLITIRFGFDFDFQKKFVKSSMPFWFTGLFIAIYFRIDTVMIAFFRGSAETGLYNASYRLLDALYFVPAAVINAIFPAMSRLYVENKAVLRSLYRKFFYYLLAIALPMGVGVTLLAERLILFIYGSEFSGSNIALQVLIWALVAVFLSSITGHLLNAVHKQLLFTLTTAFAAALNIGLNLFFIPYWGYMGAAASTLITELVVLLGLLYFARKNSYSFNIFKLLLKPLAATVVMSLVILLTLQLHVLIILPVAAITYFAALFLIKGIENEEVILIKSYLKQFI